MKYLLALLLALMVGPAVPAWAASALPCEQKDFREFLTCFTKLNKADQLQHVQFPVQVTIYDLDGEQEVAASADFFEEYTKVLAPAEEYEEDGGSLTVTEINQNTMNVVTSDCSECGAMPQDHVFVLTDQGWRMVSTTVDDTGL